MVMKLAAISAKSPISDSVGNTTKEGQSFASSIQAASKSTLSLTTIYQDSVVDYCIEWERVVTSLVDEGIKVTKKLHEGLLHYEKKVEILRRNVNSKEDSGKRVSAKLKEKSDRNETKLENAWKAHESSASMLCNLLEQVTKRGWKDLAPLVLNCIQWEIERASGDFVTFSKLPAVAEILTETVSKANVPYADEVNAVVVALADDQSESEATTGSYISSTEDANSF